MPARGVLTALVVCLIAVAPIGRGQTPREGDRRPVEEDRPVRCDHHGDPLPIGALSRLGTVRLQGCGHVAFSPDGKTLLSDSGSMWDATTGQVLRDSGVRDGYGNPLAVSPDGQMVADGGYSINFWEAATGRLLSRIPHPPDPKNEEENEGPLYAAVELAYAPDGNSLASLGQLGDVFLWDPATGEELCRFGRDRGAKSLLVIAPDGQSVSCLCHDGHVCRWEAATGKELERHRSPPGDLLALRDADGQLLALVRGPDKNVWLWRLARKETIARFRGAEIGCWKATFTPDGRILAAKVGADDHPEWRQDIRMWDAHTGRELARIPVAQMWITNLAFSPDGKRLAAGNRRDILRVWEVPSGKEAPAFPRHLWETSAVACAPNSRVVASAGWDEVIHRWDSATGRHLGCLTDRAGPVHCLTFALDGKILASGAMDGTVCLRDTVTGKEVRRLQFRCRKEGAIPEPADQDDVACLAFADGGRTVVAGNRYGAVCAWDADTGKLLRTVVDPAAVRTAALSADGRVLATSSLRPSGKQNTEPIRLWDVTTGKELRQLTHPFEDGPTLSLSPDGRFLAAVRFREFLGPAFVVLWEVASGKEMARCFVKDGVSALSFSPDSRVLAVVGFSDKPPNVTLWEVATGKPRQMVAGYGRTRDFDPSGLAFTPDSCSLVVTNRGRAPLVWDMTGRLVRTERWRGELAPRDWKAVWDALASADAEEAHRAAGALVARPEAAGAFLKSRLRVVPPLSPQRRDRLLADLDSEDFETRERATQELQQRDEEIEEALRKLLATRPSPEARRRAEALIRLREEAVLTPERLRLLRTVEVLEHLGTREAQQLLAELGSGAAQARLTQEVKASLRRLGAK